MQDPNSLADYPSEFSQKSSKNLKGEAGLKGQEAGSNSIEGPEKTVNQVAATPKIDLLNFKERLGTLSGAEVVKLIGSPEFTRIEPPARIWQYRSLVCVVNIFLYDNGGVWAVEYVDLRAREAASNDINETYCFESIIRRF